MALGKFTDIIVLLDRSGSMLNIADAVREGYNAFLTEQKAVKGAARFTLAQFSTRNDFSYTYLDVPLESVVGLTETTYNPTGGGTALLDSIGRLIEDRGKLYRSVEESNRPEKVVVVIQTDGLENASLLFTRDHIKARIEIQSNIYKWQFVYLGANQDAILVGASLGFAFEQSLTFAASNIGATNAMSSTSKGIADYRVGASSSVCYNALDRKHAVEGDDPLYDKI